MSSHQEPVNEKLKVPVSFTKGKNGKTHITNGSTCLMLVNKDHTLDVAGEQQYTPEQLFTPFTRELSSSPAIKK